MADTNGAGDTQSLLKRLGNFLRGDTASSAQMRESIQEAIEDSDRDADLSAVYAVVESIPASVHLGHPGVVLPLERCTA